MSFCSSLNLAKPIGTIVIIRGNHSLCDPSPEELKFENNSDNMPALQSRTEDANRIVL